MKPSTILGIILGILTLSLFGCNDSDNLENNSTGLEFYLIKTDSMMIPPINESLVVTEKTPIIGYNDIISYNTGKYTFTISNKAFERIQKLEVPVQHGLPFAVKLDGKLIYTGYFWSSFSSAFCDWISIYHPILSETNALKLELGYGSSSISIPDKRNDNQILKTLEKDHKLVN